MREKFNRFRAWVYRHERALSLVALFSGFAFDAFTLKRVDLPLENAFLAAHLGVAGAAIFLLHYYDRRPFGGRFFLWLRTWLPYIIEFGFGGMFCAFLIFYFRAAPLAASWPFMLVLFLAFLSTEFGKSQHAPKLYVEILLLFLSLYAFTIYHLPIVFGRMGDAMFIFSGAAALLATVLFIRLLALVIPAELKRERLKIGGGLLAALVIINGLYFANLVPPIPLALYDSGIYHSVKKTGGNFLVGFERPAWADLWRRYELIHVSPGGSVYVFSTVFAPARLETGLVHEWQHWDEKAEDWRTENEVRLEARGGREEGYRTYSQKFEPRAGYWRVRVETATGQLLGQVYFRIEPVSQTPALETKIL